MTKTFKIYKSVRGVNPKPFPAGNWHFSYDFSENGIARKIFVDGIGDACLVTIVRSTAAECDAEMWGQLNDGIFENVHFGDVFEIVNDTEIAWEPLNR